QPVVRNRRPDMFPSTLGLMFTQKVINPYDSIVKAGDAQIVGVGGAFGNQPRDGAGAVEGQPARGQFRAGALGPHKAGSGALAHVVALNIEKQTFGMLIGSDAEDTMEAAVGPAPVRHGWDDI